MYTYIRSCARPRRVAVGAAVDHGVTFAFACAVRGACAARPRVETTTRHGNTAKTLAIYDY